MMHCEDSVQYTQISSIHVSDYTPSRITRPSSNHLLQEHCSIDELYVTARPSPQLYHFLTQAMEAERKLKGKYIQVVFAETYPGCPTNTSCKETRPEMRPSSAIERPANGTVTPLCIRSRTERRRTAFRKRSDTKLSTDSGCSSNGEQETGSLPDVVREMDVEPSVVMYHNPLGRTNGAMLSCSNPRSQFQPQDFEATTRTRKQASSRSLVRPVPFQLPAHNEDVYKDLSSPENSLLLHTRTSSTDAGLPPSVEDSCYSSVTSSVLDGDSAIMSSEEPPSEELTEDAHPYDDIISPNLPDTKPITIPTSQHRPLSRRTPPVASEQPPLSLPASTPPAPVPVSPNCRGYKPLPPPKAKSQGDIYEKEKSSSSSSTFTTKDVSKSTPDLPVNEGQPHRLRSVSFMNCSAGPEMGRFPADYLGSKQVDSYIGYADTLAKELINSRPIEVMAYVTSEKLRLAPPKNASVLFKSFAMKDILSVQKCSKNRRIICVSVWKSKAAPQCHVLRCPTTLVSNALYDAILDQTQTVDDVSTDKISPPRRPSTASNDSCSSSGSVPPPPSGPTSTEPQSPSEFLHKLPAIHIGSTKADRHNSVNDIIQKVLLESHPTAAKEISVWLSLAQLRLIDMSDEREMIYESHETSRIRAIGVFSVDKRFIGYIVKEEGKPLMGHVLRCNSAALMVSLVSFLRQACQIMFSQQGGSLYDELSTDESDTEAPESSPTGGHGLIQRLKYIANPHKPLSPTASQPTFVSHTPPSQSPVSGRTADTSEDSIKSTLLSPLEIPEEDFVRFSVTYVGSAVVKLPFSSTSLTQALALFQEGGIAAGRAAVVKNVIQMHISALGINLIDKKHRLFVNRNYPRKQLAGYCRHPEDQKLFAFGSRRPGYPHEIKCHVFRQVQESADHVLEAIHHWLEMDPTSPHSQ